MSARDRAALLRALTAPRRVALIGASATASRLTARPQRFLAQHGFRGEVCPVNPARAEVLGVRTYASVADIPHAVDHAYILLETGAAVAAFEECVRAAVPVVSVLADGFAEVGDEGRRRQETLVRRANEAGILLLGPNSMGVADTRSGFICTTNAAFAADALLQGRLAVISQSGSLIGTILSRGAALGVGFSTLVSVGNEAQCGVGRVGRLLLEDPETDGFLLFLETLRYPQEFAKFARAAHAANKPVIAYVVGRSEEGRALSVSHTGALTGAAAALESFLSHHGVRRVDVFEALLEAPAAVLAARGAGPNRPRSVTVVATTGGGGAMVVDQLGARGVRIAGCPPLARKELHEQGIAIGRGKLLDVTLAGTNYETMKAVVSALMADPETGVVLVAIGSSAQFNPELSVRPIVAARREAASGAAPLLAFPLPEARETLTLLRAADVPTFRTVESCANAIGVMIDPPRVAPITVAALPDAARQMLNTAPPGVLNEVQAGAVFTHLGVGAPEQLLFDADAAPPSDLPFAFPVVAKLVSRDLPHKTEAGAIRVGIDDPQALAGAITAMRSSVAKTAPEARIDGILIQKMSRGVGEALVGLTRDPLVGPVVTVGMGGIMAEIYRDAAIRPAPVSGVVARQMLNEVRGFAALRGYRGAPIGDLDALASAVAAVSTLALHARVEEAEINPLLVCRSGALMLDALIRLT